MQTVVMTMNKRPNKLKVPKWYMDQGLYYN